MKILLVGSGGREHALAWKIRQSRLCEKLFCAPGNAGTSEIAENIPINAEDVKALADFAEKHKIGLTIVGPEAPLVEGIVNEFEKRGLKIFGPSAKAAMLEGSKIFAKKIMQKYGIPTAESGEFVSAEKALAYLKNKGVPIVVKADGLAAGKGVFVCNSPEEAENAVKKILLESAFGSAGKKILIEEFLEGEEASFLAFSDGKNILPMVSSQDHKRAFDKDLGPNTGGMGAYSPAPVVTKKLEKKILKGIMQKTIDAMKSEGAEYKGVLYAGLMIKNWEAKVLEFNARFGDPETQAILPRMKSDILEIMLACIEGNLAEKKIKWSKKHCTCVVLASGGYPGRYKKNKEIFGLEKAREIKNALVFHAGTKIENGKILTNGGRVLGISALGKTIEESIGNAYSAVSKISFEKMHCRKDIGKKAIKKKLSHIA
ncbi:MAG: phosphoribosylamine--glycine ligase [Candidatus ainarchaeum sp.]|nr:phosphoribosylamine--glycine ligase [Candidatus ainarchaeum sp.]